jgi:hypothetical protein
MFYAPYMSNEMCKEWRGIVEDMFQCIVVHGHNLLYMSRYFIFYTTFILIKCLNLCISFNAHCVVDSQRCDVPDTTVSQKPRIRFSI